ncbi:MAG: phage holin family protein [Holophagales bacterium]|nr:MAG: phage holin family protein [Holophagales bacterium]
MKLLARIVLNGIGLLVVAYLVPGVDWSLQLTSVDGILTLVGGGIVLGLLNLLVKPLLTFFSIPLLFVTLGLFYLVINGIVLKLADFFLDSLTVDGFLAAILGGLVLSIFNLLVKGIGQEKKS